MRLDYILSLIKTKANLLFYKTILFRFGFGGRITKTVWEKQYSSDSWDFLLSEDEKAHYDCVIKQVKKYSANLSVLDIGCGEGVLYNYTKNELENTFNYTGIDISDTAINKGKDKYPGIDFKTTDYDFEKVDGLFSMVIFNEVLYYFVKPINMINKAINENLAVNGVVIISMCDDGKGKNDVIWKNIDANFQVLAQDVVKNSKGWTWNIKTIMPNPKVSLALS